MPDYRRGRRQPLRRDRQGDRAGRPRSRRGRGCLQDAALPDRRAGGACRAAMARPPAQQGTAGPGDRRHGRPLQGARHYLHVHAARHTALNFLAHDLGVSAFKIGSGEVENWPYLAAIAACGKPIILSTGMYTLEQIATAADVIAGAGGRELAILHCVTSYPAAASSINLDVMRQIREFFPGPVGYSDHTEGTAVCLAAVALGADVIEKHITIDRDVPNAHDWKVSCDPSNFARFVADIREVEAARGGAPKSISAAETQSIIWARKSLTAARPIEAGETVSNDMLIAQRPGTGLPASQLSKVLGRKAARRIDAGEILQLDMLK